MAYHWYEIIPKTVKIVKSRNSMWRERADFRVDLVLLLAIASSRAHRKPINHFLVLVAGFGCAPATIIANLCQVVAAWIPSEFQAIFADPHKEYSPGRQKTTTCTKPAKLFINQPSGTITKRRWQTIAVITLENVPTIPISLKNSPLEPKKEEKTARFSFLFVSITFQSKTNSISRRKRLLTYTEERHLIPFRCSSCDSL